MLNRAQARLVLLLLLAGVGAGILWRLLVPPVAALTDEQERVFTVDGTLALLLIGAGIATGWAVLLRPGRHPVQRTIAALCGSLLAAVIAWQLGDLVGEPALRAVGTVFLWPIATAVLLFIGVSMPGTSRRVAVADGHRDRSADGQGSSPGAASHGDSREPVNVDRWPRRSRR